jgi:hypothetical protein
MANRFHQAWERIFEAKNFDLFADVHYISATEIKEITGEEPRLMAKADSSKDVPAVMRDNGYFLLPVNNGKYAIVRGKGFHELEDISSPIEFSSRIKFNLSTAMRNTSEMQYLDYCFASGLIEEVIDRGVLYSSIRGRERSGKFSFTVNKTELHVDWVQIEVDLGLEGEDCVVLLEAKVRDMKDFIIRQLYYPYRRFTNLPGDKKIIPAFFTYDSALQTYNFWIYEFVDLKNYNSLRLIKTLSYQITTKNELTLADVTSPTVEYSNVIPQANDLDKVIELVFKVSEGLNNAALIADYFSFDKRQSSYYREAAEALGLINRNGNEYMLTAAGSHLTSLQTQERNIYVTQILSDFKLIREGLETIKREGTIVKKDLEKLIETSSNLSGTTIQRRAHSLMSWYKWIAENTGTIVINGEEITRA